MQLSNLLLAVGALAAAGAPLPAKAASITTRDGLNDIYYCEPWTVDRSFIQAPSWMTWNVEIWNTTGGRDSDGGGTGEADLVELVKTDFKGKTFTWVPDLPANSTIRLRMTPNDPTGQNSGFAVSFAGAIQPTTKRCDQSKLNLTYSAASVLVPEAGSDGLPRVTALVWPLVAALSAAVGGLAATFF